MLRDRLKSSYTPAKIGHVESVRCSLYGRIRDCIRTGERNTIGKIWDRETVNTRKCWLQTAIAQEVLAVSYVHHQLPRRCRTGDLQPSLINATLAITTTNAPGLHACTLISTSLSACIESSALFIFPLRVSSPMHYKGFQFAKCHNAFLIYKGLRK